MRAALVRELPADAPAPGDVADVTVTAPDELVLAVDACGICGTDLHILAGESYRPELPFVLGHEPVGTVVAAGEDACRWLGRRVAVSLFVGDGTCALCRAGDERLCEHLVSITGVLGSAGGFAERLAIRASQAVPVPETLGSGEAAALVDAGATAVNAARAVAAHAGGVAILGAGPVGWLLAELLRAAGRELAVVEPNALRRERLAALGHAVVERAADIGFAPDVVAECSGAGEAVPWGLRRLRPQGLLVLVGYGPVPGLDLAPVARKELTVRGIRSGRRDDLVSALELAARGEVRLPPLERWPLEEIEAAFSALRAGAVQGKAIIDVAASRPEGTAWKS